MLVIQKMYIGYTPHHLASTHLRSVSLAKHRKLSLTTLKSWNCSQARLLYRKCTIGFSATFLPTEFTGVDMDPRQYSVSKGNSGRFFRNADEKYRPSRWHTSLLSPSCACRASQFQFYYTEKLKLLTSMLVRQKMYKHFSATYIPTEFTGIDMDPRQYNVSK